MSDISPYVSLGRLRLVQKLLDLGQDKKPLDAIFCATGEDSDYSEGSLDLVCKLDIVESTFYFAGHFSDASIHLYKSLSMSVSSPVRPPIRP